MGTLRFSDSPDVDLIAYTFSFGNGFSATLSLEDGIERRAGLVRAGIGLGRLWRPARSGCGRQHQVCRHLGHRPAFGRRSPDPRREPLRDQRVLRHGRYRVRLRHPGQCRRQPADAGCGRCPVAQCGLRERRPRLHHRWHGLQHRHQQQRPHGRSRRWLRQCQRQPEHRSRLVGRRRPPPLLDAEHPPERVRFVRSHQLLGRDASIPSAVGSGTARSRDFNELSRRRPTSSGRRSPAWISAWKRST